MRAAGACIAAAGGRAAVGASRQAQQHAGQAV